MMNYTIRGLGWTTLHAQQAHAARERGNEIAVSTLRMWLRETDAPEHVLQSFNRLCAEARRGERVEI